MAFPAPFNSWHQCSPGRGNRHPARGLAARGQPGFSLIELLITSVIGAVILIAVTTVAVSFTNASSTQLRIQRLRSDWRKVQDLITTEVGESVVVSTNPALVRDCDTTGGTLLFVMFVPIYDPGGPGVENITEQIITYYTIDANGDTQLRRCGPSISLDGTLNPDRYIGRDPLFGSQLPGALVLEGIDFDPVGLSNGNLTINPSNPIQNAVTPFTVRGKVQTTN